MHRNDFFAAVKSGDIARAYLFQGPEQYVKERALAALREKLLPEGLQALNDTVLNQPPAAKIIEAAETMPIFCERRLVVAQDFQPLAAAKSKQETEESHAIAEWLLRAPETSCVVFMVRGNVDNRKKTGKEILSNLVNVEFQNLDEREMEKWIAARTKQLRASMAPGAAAKLSFYAGPALTRIEQEIEKLAAYAGERAITPEDVEAMVAPSLESSVFKLFDILADGKAADAVRLLKELITAGESPMGILYMLTRQVRILLRVKQSEGMNLRPIEIEKKMNMNPYALKRALLQARRFSLPSLYDAYALLVGIDEKIKSGAARDIDALHDALFRLLGAREVVSN